MSLSKLCTAVSQGDYLSVKCALREGEDADTCMPYEFPEIWGGKCNKVPVLLVAVENHQVDILNILLDNKASVDFRGDFERTPLSRAATKGYFEIAETLLHYKANVIARDSKYSALPIHAAASNDHVQLGKLLISHRSPVDPRNKFENTPLHVAAAGGRMQATQWLVAIGADIRALNSDKRTPSEEAKFRGHIDVSSWLLSCESNLPATLSKLRLTTNVVLDQVQKHNKKVYIFNFIEFNKISKTKFGIKADVVDNREGAKLDSDNLKKTFGNLEYDVNLHEDKTAEQMNTILDCIQQDTNLPFIFLVILSHGLNNDDTFYTADGLPYSLKSIQQRFTDTECPHLEGRSKIVIANFCRGSNIEKLLPALAHTQGDFMERDAGASFKEPPHHMITIHASHEGFAAMRDTNKGTAFVYNLCASLQDNVTQPIQDTFNDTYERIKKNGGQTPKMEVSAPFAKFSI